FEAGEVGAKWVTGRWRTQAARALMIDLQGPAEASLVIDQIRVLPPVGPDGEKPYFTNGVGAAGVMTDMQYASGAQDAKGLVQWPEGRGTITFQPPTDRNYDTLWLHAIKPAGGQWPARVQATCGDKTLTTEVGAPEEQWAAYIPVRVPVTRGRRVEVVLSGAAAGPPLALDEVELDRSENLAFGKTYTYEPLPAKPAWNYPDDGKKLTDGALANTFMDGKLAGWINCKPKIVLDLGQAVPVQKVRVHAWGGGMADTWFPKSITIWTASDGTEWRLMPEKIMPPEEPEERKTNARVWLEGRVTGPATRYVRLDLVSHDFLLLDEIEVISNGVNVASGKGYRTIAPPPPRLRGTYADDGVRLTDGRYSAPYMIPERVVGYPDVDPIVTVDLQQPQRVTLASAHACGGNFFGVGFPTETRVQTSLDGDTWSAPVVATSQRGEKRVGLIEAPLDVTARYVRWQFKRQGMCLIDEVEVYGE
ncbi:MAG: discoidin domain-containing protein, partial [Armatimonadia bacterium]